MTGREPIGVLALQGDVANHLRLLDGLGVAATRVRQPAELAGLAGLIVPGGESTAMWRLAEDFGLLEPVADLIRDGLPVFGSCAGMIMLADRVLDGRPDQRTFGGMAITVRRNAFGRQVNSFEAAVKMPVLGERPFPGVFIRAPWVDAADEVVDILGTVPGQDGRPHPVAVQQGKLLATAFHPELTDDARLHEYFVTSVVAG